DARQPQRLTRWSVPPVYAEDRSAEGAGPRRGSGRRRLCGARWRVLPVRGTSVKDAAPWPDGGGSKERGGLRQGGLMSALEQGVLPEGGLERLLGALRGLAAEVRIPRGVGLDQVE